LKLVERLTNHNEQNCLLIFDEPTTGLHFDDVAILVRVLDQLVERGHSVLVIEHNLEVIKCADYVIDLGPEAGNDGGEVVAKGTPEEVARVRESHTGRFLKQLLGKSGTPYPETDDLAGDLRVAERPRGLNSKSPTSNSIVIHGARQHNLKNIDVAVPRDQLV